MPGAKPALAGALRFLTRLPVGAETAEWDAFRRSPWTFPVVGYGLGILIAPAVLLPIPAATVAVVLPAWIIVLTGIIHLDGAADVGDAAAIHEGDVSRREAMRDPHVGTGGALAVAGVVLGLAAAGALLATLPLAAAAGIVIAAEVGAKFGMAVLGAGSTAAHEGLGSAVSDGVGIGGVAIATVLALPAALATAPHPAALVALLGGPIVAVGLRRWAADRLGGISGDVFGATNEAGRVLGLHLGVIAWVTV